MPTALADYSSLFHALPGNYLLIAPDGTILDNTNGHVAVSLKPRAQVVGRHLFEAFPAVDQNEGRVLADSLEHVRQHRQAHTMPVIRYDLERPAEQGGGFEESYWQATHYPILDDAGELRYILQQTENVTEQRRAELQRQQMQAALAASEANAHLMLEALPVMVWTARPDGKSSYLNQRWLDYTGHATGQDLDENWLHVVHPDDRPRVAQTWQEAIAGRTIHELEYRLRRYDGQYRWHLIRTVPQFGPDGTLTRWVGCGTDIEEQRQLVQELTTASEQQASLADQAYEAAQQARSQRETFHNLFMHAPAMISIVRGPEYVFEFVNPPYQQLRPSLPMVGRTVAEVFPEALEQGFGELLAQVYRTGEPFHGRELPLHFDRYGTGTPVECFFDFTYQAFREDGHIVGITSFAFDVTERVRMRQQLEQSTNGRPTHA